MAALMRMIFSIVISAFVARIVEGLMSPKKKQTLDAGTNGKTIPTVDLKPCPVCGVYTAQPATHCKS